MESRRRSVGKQAAIIYLQRIVLVLLPWFRLLGSMLLYCTKRPSESRVHLSDCFFQKVTPRAPGKDVEQARHL